MTIAVTAASGQLGREVLQALLRLNVGRPIIGLARSPSRAADLGVDIRPGDYSDSETLTGSLAGVDALLLISGNGPPEERIVQHRNVIDAARAAGVRRIVYTSIQGAEQGTAFSPVVQSNRQTEADIRSSGLNWAIGRNGIYIEPDIDYIPNYVAAGEIVNCAGNGRCGYATRFELAHAYARLLIDDARPGDTYNLHGDRLTQNQLASYLSQMADSQILYRAISAKDYLEDRTRELGPFIGAIITGIYEGIRDGALDHPSDYEAAAGRPHQSWDDYFQARQP
uniref:SDR family oxidoreductase n=1 Tax=Pararhizobium sp. IMCC3301 TaxID=3067904 RepID=UPI00274286A6|nr:SDR family oxidoreductase [Pararhizobium sp. IMCC3301]